MEEDTLYSPLSPDVIDISSNSDNEFIVEPGNVPQLLDRFRVNTTGEDHTCVRSSTWWVRTRNGHKVGRTHFSLGGTYTKTLTWLLIILIDMHWWDLNTISFRRFSAIKNTY